MERCAACVTKDSARCECVKRRTVEGPRASGAVIIPIEERDAMNAEGCYGCDDLNKKLVA